MSDARSTMLAAVGAVLTSLVLVAATSTSQARFAASTENTGNLWEAAELSLRVEADGANTAQLFLDAEGLHPGLTISNCVVLSTESSLASIDVRIHGSIIDQSRLQDFVEVTIELGAPSTECADFEPVELLFSGDLAVLTADHGSFGDGLPVSADPKGRIPLRFTGSIRDDNDAQGLLLDYMVLLEARP